MRLLRPALGVGVGTLALFAGIATATAGNPSQPRVQLQPAAAPPITVPQPAGAGAADEVQPYMIQLDGRPALEVAQMTRRTTRSATQAARSGRSQRASNVSAQASVMSAARQRGLIRHELFRVRSAYNGIAVMARPSDVARLQRVRGVQSVRPIPIHERRHAYSVPSTGAPDVWKAAAGANTGQGIRVGVLDSGVDYTHATFSGSGTAADLADARSPANNPLATSPNPGSFEAKNDAGDTIYPNATVVGGFDFVGDDYDTRFPESSIPRPDPNPMDCPLSLGGGHGSHVAGSVGGRGVTADGSTYTGGYDPVAPGLKLDPGVAPGVEIYSLRVFGCNGGTAFIAQAIDWAVDPNQDGDPSDHLDVLNISAGSDFGYVDGPEVEAAQTASNLGVAVVISAGNNGNLTHTVGAPGVAPASLTVANLSTGDWVDRFRIENAGSEIDGELPARASGSFPWTEMDSEISGELVRAPADNLRGCEPFDVSLAGKVVLLDVRSAPGAEMGCPSAVRADHAEAAGAIGVVMADHDAAFGPQMGGSEEIPLMHVRAPERTALLTALADGAVPTVTFTGDLVAVDYDPTLADTADPSTSRGPAGGGGLKPEIGAPGSSIKSASAGTGSGTAVMGGTSMAAPHVSGAAALLRKHRKSWTVEEVKAALVNTARPDVHVEPGHAGRRESTARVGSGAMDVAAALRTTSIAYAADAAGAVAVGFGWLQVPVGVPFAAERTVRVANKGVEAATYAVSFAEITTVPGVRWKLPDGPSVTVAPGATADLRVRLEVTDPSQLRNARDMTIPEFFTFDEHALRQRWLAEATGLLRLVSGPTSLSVPVHAAVRPAAATSTASAVELPAGESDGALVFSGATFDSGATSGDFLATRMALEWQSSSPRLPEENGVRPPAYADIEHVGVTERDGWLTFGASTHGTATAPNQPSSVQVLIDVDHDDVADFRIFQHRPDDSSTFLTCVVDATDPENVTGCEPSLLNRLAEDPGFYDSRLTLLSVRLEMLGLDGADRAFRYHVVSNLTGESGFVDNVGPISYDPAAPALRYQLGPDGAKDATGLHADAAGTLPFRLDRGRAESTGTRGALILRPLALGDQQAQTVSVSEGAPRPPVDPPYEPPVQIPPPPVDPPIFQPHDLRLPQPPLARLPVHRRQVRVAGGRLTITGPRQCVRRGSRFTVTVSGRRTSRSGSFGRIVRTEFRIDGRRVATDRRAPFRQRIRATRTKSGALHRVTARTVIELRSGKRITRNVVVRFRACG